MYNSRSFLLCTPALLGPQTHVFFCLTGEPYTSAYEVQGAVLGARLPRGTRTQKWARTAILLRRAGPWEWLGPGLGARLVFKLDLQLTK